MTITRLAILGDVLRPHPVVPSRSEAVTRTRWLHDLLSPPLSRATHLPVTCLTADGSPLIYRELYDAAGMTPSPEAWASLYGADLPPALADLVLEACRDALVIGIELPPSIARTLARAGVPAVDGSVHPWRFLSDIPLAWRSTQSAVAEALAPFVVDHFDVERHVAAIRAKVRWLGAPPLEPGTTLVLDQLPEDAAMIDARRGRRCDWADHHEVLRELQRRGPVVWRPHPYAARPSALLEYLGAEAMTDANFYTLLCSDRLEAVVAISSGGVVEARAFGKRGLHLLERDYGHERDGWTTPLPVRGHWLSPHFWAAVLAPVIATDRGVPIVAPEPDVFRRANNTDWDYGWINQVVERRTAREARDREASHRLETARARAEVIASGVHTLDLRTTHLAQQVDALSHQLAHDLNDVRKQLARLTTTEQVRSIVRRLAASARDQGWRVGVLGAGSHTRWLLEQASLDEVAGLRIFDRDPTAVGRRCGRYPIESSADLPALNLDRVLVSSLSFEDEMVGDLVSLGIPRDRIVTCYR